jgi:hypothetical protein
VTTAVPRHRIPEAGLDVVHPGRRAHKARIPLLVGHDITFSAEALRTYAFARWEPATYDLLLLTAAVEYADKAVRRSSLGWRRRISVRIPVHDVARWTSSAVSQPLHRALSFLTGDAWSLEFVRRSRAVAEPSDTFLPLGAPTVAVLPYSDGMDSRIVAGLLGATLGDRLIRVRVGSNTRERPLDPRTPFALVPYHVPGNMPNRETSARSRGLKFALISGIAAYLTDAKIIIVPESGQGAIGPALVTVGHTYPDYRSHPLFTVWVERFLSAFLNKDLRYEFPRLWHTKGETLREFVTTSTDDAWRTTRSCWRGNQWSSVGGKRRQCGVCAACLLRRLAVYSAGLTEPPETYICLDMTAPTLAGAVDPCFTKLNRTYREYAIAGVRHMYDLAAMAGDENRPDVVRHAALLARALGLSPNHALTQLSRLLRNHAQEWKCFLDSLGPQSFVVKWSRR